VTEGREVALRLFLDSAKGSGDRSGAGTSTQDDDGIHLQHITTEQDSHRVRENRDHKADEDQADPDFWSPEKKLGPAASPTQAMKTVKPTVSKIHMADPGIRPNVG